MFAKSGVIIETISGRLLLPVRRLCFICIKEQMMIIWTAFAMECSAKKWLQADSISSQQECILFCAGKTRVISNCSHLFRSHMLRSCQFRVGILYFAQVCTTFVVYSVTNSKSNARKNGWYCIKT